MTRLPYRHSKRAVIEPSWVCLGVTDEWHPWCPFETKDRSEARQHAQHEGHFCVNADRTEERA